jgi:hypothetical protein
MDPTTAAGIIGAGAALSGATLAGGTSLAIERLRARESAREAHRGELRSACSEFTSAIARVRSNSYHLNHDTAAKKALLSALEEARVGCERLRILLSDKATQQAARMVLRHTYAVWKLAEDGADPRAAEYPGKEPEVRLREELTHLYVGVRRELGLANPEDVFEDLDD